MDQIVIADAGPLIALARIAQLDLLAALFGNVTVTSLVAEEVLSGGNFPDESQLTLAFSQPWLHCIEVDNDMLDMGKRLMDLYQIDPGEASAMVVAQQAQAQGVRPLLVMDDFRGRSAAQHARLPVIGTTGLLLLAKQNGHLSLVKPLLLSLRQHGYFLSQKLIDSALKQAAE